MNKHLIAVLDQTEVEMGVFEIEDGCIVAMREFKLDNKFRIGNTEVEYHLISCTRTNSLMFMQYNMILTDDIKNTKRIYDLTITNDKILGHSGGYEIRVMAYKTAEGFK